MEKDKKGKAFNNAPVTVRVDLRWVGADGI